MGDGLSARCDRAGTAAYGIVRSLTPEPRSGTMLAATMAGALLVVRPGADGGRGPRRRSTSGSTRSSTGPSVGSGRARARSTPPQRAVAPDPTAPRSGRLHRGPVLARPVADEDRPREAARLAASDDPRRRRDARRRLVRGGHRRAEGPDASDSVDAGAVRPGARRARWRQHPRGDRRSELRRPAEHVS